MFSDDDWGIKDFQQWENVWSIDYRGKFCFHWEEKYEYSETWSAVLELKNCRRK